MSNYFNKLSLTGKLGQLGKCRLMNSSEFDDGIKVLEGKKIVIIGCGAQGLNQGLNMRDSGLNISYALRSGAIKEKRDSYKNATENNFDVDTYDNLVPSADLVVNLTPDKNHTSVIEAVMPLMKKGSTLSYSHGFNIVEEGIEIVSGGTDSHVILCDLRPLCLTGKISEESLDRSGITCNKNAIPFDTEKPFITSGLRIGTPAVTTRGFKEKEMIEVGKLIGKVLKGLVDNQQDNTHIESIVLKDVKSLCDNFPLYPSIIYSKSKE